MLYVLVLCPEQTESPDGVIAWRESRSCLLESSPAQAPCCLAQLRSGPAEDRKRDCMLVSLLCKNVFLSVSKPMSFGKGQELNSSKLASFPSLPQAHVISVGILWLS